jgi:hypothetical protein
MAQFKAARLLRAGSKAVVDWSAGMMKDDVGAFVVYELSCKDVKLFMI